jgi:hypothetical protein
VHVQLVAVALSDRGKGLFVAGRGLPPTQALRKATSA